MTEAIQKIMDKYKNFDPNVDGHYTIDSLRYTDFERPTPLRRAVRLILVLIEPQLLEPLSDIEGDLNQNLNQRLIQFKDDLAVDGFASRFIRASVYRGKRDQDGRTVLALRKFFREVKTDFPKFSGVIFIGAFPEATLVRRWIWAPAFRTTIGRVYTDGLTPYLCICPEVIASRGEIVLADLSGRWDEIYHEEPMELEHVLALPDASTATTLWPVDGAVFSSEQFTREKKIYNDFFFIQDDNYELLDSPQGILKLLLHLQLRNPEVGLTDQSLPNPLAKPDILISRINAKHVAVKPDPEIHGDDGTKPLNDEGFPQTFTSSNIYINTGFSEMFVEDKLLERRLLCEYFDRNHKFRQGEFAYLPFRAAVITTSDFTDAQWIVNTLTNISEELQPAVIQEAASLLDYVKWFKMPATIRFIHAHANRWGTMYGDNYNVTELETAVGGCPFRWVRQGNNYVPSLDQLGGIANLSIHRSMWQNNMLANVGPYLLIHAGCDVLSVADGYVQLPGDAYVTSPAYWQVKYAVFQNAETLLFYMNGLATVARAKTFNDLPTHAFATALSMAYFGMGWKTYFDECGNDASGPSNPARCKIAYSWSMIGDWTLRLRYEDSFQRLIDLISELANLFKTKPGPPWPPVLKREIERLINELGERVEELQHQ